MTASNFSRDGQLPIVPSPSVITGFRLADRAGCSTISNKLSEMLGVNRDILLSNMQSLTQYYFE